MLACDNCSASILPGANFCPQCGKPHTKRANVNLPVSDNQVANVEISFGQSSSANFTKAVEICQNIPTYSVTGEGNQAQHKISLPITEIDLIINLYELVGSWKSSQMLINGRSATKKDLTYYGVGCYRNRQRAYKPDQYCFGEKTFEMNIWGCKRLNMPIYEWGGGWLEYGEFDNSGVWHFNKDRIRHELELGIKENELCPVLDRKHVLETLNKLPDSINPKVDKNWEYKISFEDIDGEYKEVAVGIKPVINKLNKYVIGTFKPSWEINESESQSDNDPKFIISESNQSNPGILNPEVKNEPHKNKNKKNSSKTLIWVFVGVIILLFFLFR